MVASLPTRKLRLDDMRAMLERGRIVWLGRWCIIPSRNGLLAIEQTGKSSVRLGSVDEAIERFGGAS